MRPDHGDRYLSGLQRARAGLRAASDAAGDMNRYGQQCDCDELRFVLDQLIDDAVKGRTRPTIMGQLSLPWPSQGRASS